MNIRIRETMYIRSGDVEHIVRPGTIGVEHKKVVYFYDVTRTVAAGFSRDFCLENPQIFNVSRSLSDKEVFLRDVLKVIDESDLDSTQIEKLCQRIKAL